MPQNIYELFLPSSSLQLAKQFSTAARYNVFCRCMDTNHETQHNITNSQKTPGAMVFTEYLPIILSVALF